MLCAWSYEELFKPGQHYEIFKYDLSDFVEQTYGLLEKFDKGDVALLDVARRASDRAIEVFNFFGELDSLMYAVLKVSVAVKGEKNVHAHGERTVTCKASLLQLHIC
jgi:hypothetical protein